MLTRVVLLAFAVALPAVAAELTANVDRSVVDEDETLQLTVRLNEQVGFDSPDFSKLQDDFDILSQQRSSQFRSINGRTEAWTDWNLVLAPRRRGSLTIPSFSFAGASSNPVKVQVNTAQSNTGGEPRETFVVVETNKDEVFVQEELLLTIRIHTGILLRDASMNESLEVNNAVVESVSETAYNKRIDGRMYRVMELVYAIYPQKSDAMTIPSLSWNLVMATERGSGLRYRFRAPGELRRVRSEPKTIPVKPRPASYQGDHWLPAKSVKLEQHWSSDPSRFVVGEPITRTITLTAEGLTSAQLPPLPYQDVDGIKVYADQPQFDDIKNSQGIIGSRIESVAIVPNQAGELTLPEMRVHWWNTATGQEEIATLPAQNLTIASAATGGSLPFQAPTPLPDEPDLQAPQTLSEIPAQSLWPWLLSNAVFATLACVFFFAWLRARRRDRAGSSAPNTTEEDAATEEAFHRIRRACADNNPRAARQALGQWGQRHWQLSHQATLQDVARHSDSRAIAKELAKLDGILYGGQQLGPEAEGWRGDSLWRALVRFKRKDKKKRQQQSHTDQLAPLYPNM